MYKFNFKFLPLCLVQISVLVCLVMALLPRSVQVTGIPIGVNDTQVRALLQQYGTVSHCVLETPSGNVTSAYAVFEDAQSATDAIAGSSDSSLKLGGKAVHIRNVVALQQADMVRLMPDLSTLTQTPSTGGDEDKDIDAIIKMLDATSPTKRRKTLEAVMHKLSIVAGPSGATGLADSGGIPNAVTPGAGSGQSGDRSLLCSTRVSFGESVSIPNNGATNSIIIENSAGPPRRLRLFSGKIPVPNGEVEYSTWRLHAKQMLESSKNENEKKKCILDSLCRPALELVSGLDSARADEIFAELERLFGAVHDTHAIMAKLHDTLQVAKETPSSFLQRLHLVVREAVECKAILPTQLMTTTVRQFNFGLLDETLAQRLKLDELEVVPPAFSVLMQQVRREEARQAERLARRSKVVKVNQTHCVDDNTDVKQSKNNSKVSSVTNDDKMDEVRILQQQVSDQQKQIKSLESRLKSGSGSKSTGDTGKKQSKFRGFCYNCGKDNHKNQDCVAPANPEYVHQRLQQRKFSGRRRGNNTKDSGND